VKAFYTGVLQDTGKSIVDSFLFFLFYNYIRTNRLQKNGTKATTLPVLDELAVGALAGACSKFFTTPISNIVTRKQTSSLLSSHSSSMIAEPSLREIAQSIRDEKGIQGFWSGYSASLVLTLNPSLTFFLHETFKRALLPRSRRDDPSTRATFLLAAVSKAIASTITYPFSLAKTRAQASASPPIDPSSTHEIKTGIESASDRASIEKAGKGAKAVAKRSTVFSTILHIYREEGPAGLYAGVWGEIMKGFLGHGITMLVKEQVHRVIIRLYYAVLKGLKRYPSPGDMGEKVGEGFENISARVGGVVGSGKQIASEGLQRAGAITSNTTDITKRATNDAFDVAKVGLERVGVVTSNTTEAAKAADKYTSKEAGHLLGNAQEQLGNKIENLGKGMKEVKND
jgi:hypothetical protein